jgi:hypothetical protein
VDGGEGAEDLLGRTAYAPIEPVPPGVVLAHVWAQACPLAGLPD